MSVGILCENGADVESADALIITDLMLFHILLSFHGQFVVAVTC